VVRPASLVLAALLATAAVAPAGASSDRLERFRSLATSRLSAQPADDGERDQAVLRELAALLDEEIVESLALGGVFASLGFLQDRLDGLADVWGGASFRLLRVGPLTVGAFVLGEGTGAASVRVYGPVRGEPQLLRVFQREGRPTVHPLPAAGGRAQFLMAWEGPPAGPSARRLRLDVVRQAGEDVRVVWTTAALYPDGLAVRSWRLRDGEVRLRYELRHPGWVPGCEAQAELEDVWRLSADGATLERTARRQFNAWHAALHRAVAAFFDALAAADQAALAELVPDPGLRRRLPPTLAPEPACDAADGGNPVSVSVAAAAGERQPWTLVWQRGEGGRWRLVAAGPVRP
jgi:hypothetical protein